MPGASPTINRRAFGSPNESTGALNQPGSRARVCARKSASLGHSGQLGSGRVAGATRLLLVEIVIGGPWRHGGRALQELRSVMPRFARRRALGRIAAELGLQL